MPSKTDETFSTVLVADREYFRSMVLNELRRAVDSLSADLRGLGEATRAKELTGHSRESLDRGIAWINECRDLLSQIGYSEREARRMERESDAPED